MLIRQYDYCTDVPQTGHNKRPHWNVLSHSTTPHCHHFSTISRLQRHFRRCGSTSNRPHNRRLRGTTPAQDLHIQHVPLQDRLRPAAATIWLEQANIHIRRRLARWRGVLFTDESWFSLFRADGRQRVRRRVGWCQWCGSMVAVRVMVWSGVCYGQWTQVHFIDGILNAQRYRDEILKFTVVPFIHNHHLMLQHDNAPTEHVWDALDTTRTRYVYDSMFQFLPISSNFTQPLKRSGPTFHRPQSTTWSTLCEGDVRQMEANGGHTRYWLVFWSPQYSKTAHFSVAFYCGQSETHLCNNHTV